MEKTFKHPYFNEIVRLLERIENTQQDAMRRAAQAVAGCPG